MEDFYIGGASVKLFLPIFEMNFPEIVDIALPAEGVFHNLVFVSIKKTYPTDAAHRYKPAPPFSKTGTGSLSSTSSDHLRRPNRARCQRKASRENTFVNLRKLAGAGVAVVLAAAASMSAGVRAREFAFVKGNREWTRDLSY